MGIDLVRTVHTVVALFSILGLAGTAWSQGAASENRTAYAMHGFVAEPVAGPAFIPLKPGAIEPEGWLRDWAVAFRNGITGHVDERHPVYKNGWRGVLIYGWENDCIGRHSILSYGSGLPDSTNNGNYIGLDIADMNFRGGSFWDDKNSHTVNQLITDNDLDQWVHWAVTHDGPAWRLYRNGQEVGKAQSGRVDRPKNQGWTIGATTSASSRVSFRGGLADVAVYSNALSSDRIKAHYEAGKGGDEKRSYVTTVLADKPVGYWRLHETATNQPAKDETGNNLDGRYVGKVIFSQPGPDGATNSSVRFAGNTACVDLGNPDKLDLKSGNATLEAWVKLDGSARGTGWPLEQCAYWFDGMVRLALILHDDALLAKAKERFDVILNGLTDKSGSFIFWLEAQPNGFNSWAHSHFARAMVCYYEGTGDKRALVALRQVYEKFDLPVTGDCLDGIVNAEPMLETYALTGDKVILDRALATWQKISPRTWKEKGNTHGVCYDEASRVPFLFYPWTGNTNVLAYGMERIHYAEQNHGLPYGVHSGQEGLSGIGPSRHTESCDVATWPWLCHWAYLIDGGAEWGDRREATFFNAAPAVFSRDALLVTYFQSPNRMTQPTRAGYVKLTGPLCCVSNPMRCLPHHVMSMWMATPDRGLAATLYGPCKVNTLVGAEIPVKFECKTCYPFDENIAIAVEPSVPVDFPLYLRIPAWCKAPAIAVNGQTVKTQADGKGFVKVDRKWKSGDRVAINLPFTIRIETGKAPANLSAAVYYGPLLFALPLAEIDENRCDPKAKWNYALDVDLKAIEKEISVEQKTMPEKWDWPLDAPIVLTVPARSFDWKPTDANALPAAPVTEGTAEKVRLVPYGCTKFHVSMFPVTARLWDSRPDTASGQKTP